MPQRQRNMGIELLRIISMVLIIMIHLLWQGGLMYAVKHGTPQYYVGWTLQCAVIPCVNLFAIISGYVGFGTRHRLSSGLRLCLQMLVLCLGITLVALVLRVPMGKKEIARSLVPVFFGRYWYMAGYLCAFPFFALLDRMIDTLSERKARTLVITLLLLTSVIPTLAMTDFATTKRGFSAIWIAIMYVLGACIRKHGWWKGTSPLKGNLVYLATTAMMLASKVVLDDLLLPALTGSFDQNASVWVTYDSPFAIAGAIALVCSFPQLRVPKTLEAHVSFWARLAFGVYLVHSAPLVYDRVIHGRTAWIAALHPLAIIPVCLAICVGIYVVSGLVDLLRERLFVALRVSEWLARFDDERYRIV